MQVWKQEAQFAHHRQRVMTCHVCFSTTKAAKPNMLQQKAELLHNSVGMHALLSALFCGFNSSTCKTKSCSDLRSSTPLRACSQMMWHDMLSFQSVMKHLSFVHAHCVRNSRSFPEAMVLQVQILKQLPFLQNTSADVFRRLLQRGELVKYKKGEVMWQPPTGNPSPTGHTPPLLAFCLLPFLYTLLPPLAPHPPTLPLSCPCIHCICPIPRIAPALHRPPPPTLSFALGISLSPLPSFAIRLS